MKKLIKTLLAVAIVATCLTFVAFAESTLVTYSWWDATEYNVNGNLSYDLGVNIQQRNDEVVTALYTKITFNNEVLIPVDASDYETPVALVDGSKVEDITPFWTASVTVGSGRNQKTYSYDVQEYSWTTNGNKTTLEFTIGTTNYANFDFENLDIMGIAFKPADGVTVEELTATDIVIEEIFLGAGQDVNGNPVRYGHNYTGTEVALGELSFVNELAPEAAAITIPVAAGDKVYLQDGTVAEIAEANEAYEVPATVGYVAVNTGYTSQKTYYVDGTTATLVHTNGVVASEETGLRGPEPDDEANDRGAGVRFKTEHATAGRTNADHAIVEVGFVMTVESDYVLGKAGEDYVLDMNMVDKGWANYGYAYQKGGKNVAYNTDDDTNYIITGVFYGIPMTEAGVKTTIVSRPYYKVGETYIYGEITKTTLYDKAWAIKSDSEKYDALSDEHKAYVDEIVFLVKGTEIIEDEVIIDIGGLYD